MSSFARTDTIAARQELGGQQNVFDNELNPSQSDRERSESTREPQDPVQRWLSEELELAFNPFQHLDAGQDVNLPAYLVEHSDFDRLWGKWPTFLFAPSGGGKTAFRVRLARACRSMEEGKRFFPVTVRLPDPAAVGIPPNRDHFFKEILHSTGRELLFYLAYHAYEFSRWDTAKQQQLRQCLAKSGIPLEYYVDQIEEAGSLVPLAMVLDQTELSSNQIIVPLPREPLAASLQTFCRSLRQVAHDGADETPPLQRLVDLWQSIQVLLDQEAIFVLVDDVDAYTDDPEKQIALVRPLLERTREWAEGKILLKFFLPKELYPLLGEKARKLLTAPSQLVIIEWSRERLIQVLRERLRVASQGMFDSLKAMGSPGFPYNAEESLAAKVDPAVPREIIYLAGQILARHIQRIGTHGRLEPEDLRKALDHYNQ